MLKMQPGRHLSRAALKAAHGRECHLLSVTHFKTSPGCSVHTSSLSGCLSGSRTHARMHVHAHAHSSLSFRGLQGGEKSTGFDGKLWQVTECCTLKQMESGSFPLERLLAVFVFSSFFFNILDFFHYCLSDCFWLVPNIHCLPLFSSVSPQLTGHPQRTTFAPFLFPSLPFFHSFPF